MRLLADALPAISEMAAPPAPSTKLLRLFIRNLFGKFGGQDGILRADWQSAQTGPIDSPPPKF
jgi:hypothetical protein